MNHAHLAIAALAVMLLVSCAGIPQLAEVKEVHVCAKGECIPAAQRYTSTHLLQGLYQLLKRSEGRDLTLCTSDPAGRNCASEGVSFFMMGGPLPGMASVAHGHISDVRLDETNRAIVMTINWQKRFLGVPLACTPQKSTVIVRSVDEIVWTDDGDVCTWLGVGGAYSSSNIAMDFIDFDKGRVAGYWSSGVVGMGGGKGSGYGLVMFPAAMQKGESWF